MASLENRIRNMSDALRSAVEALNEGDLDEAEMYAIQAGQYALQAVHKQRAKEHEEEEKAR